MESGLGSSNSTCKTFILHIGKHNTGVKYKIDNIILQETSSVRDLGIEINESLSFNSHINKIVKNAFYRSIQLLRTIHSTNPKIWSISFKSYVRPILEYGPEIWNPMTKILTNQIEKVQKFYTFHALKKCKRSKIAYLSLKIAYLNFMIYSVRVI